MAVQVHKFGPSVQIGRYLSLYTGKFESVAGADGAEIPNPTGLVPALLRSPEEARAWVDRQLERIRTGRRPDFVVTGRPGGTQMSSIVSATESIKLWLGWWDLPIPRHVVLETERLMRGVTEMGIPQIAYVGPIIAGEVMNGSNPMHRLAFRDAIRRFRDTMRCKSVAIDTAIRVTGFERFVEIGEEHGMLVIGEGWEVAERRLPSTWIGKATRGPSVTDYAREVPFRHRDRHPGEPGFIIGVGWKDGGLEGENKVREWADRGWRDLLGWTDAGWDALCRWFPEQPASHSVVHQPAMTQKNGVVPVPDRPGNAADGGAQISPDAAE